MIKETVRIALYFMMLGFSYYALSSLDLSKLMLNIPQRGAKAMVLLILLCLALAYLSTQFILAIGFNL